MRENEIKGKIIRIDEDKGFTIIKSKNDSEQTYLGHFSVFNDSDIDLNHTLINRDVAFIPEYNGKMNRFEATYVRII